MTDTLLEAAADALLRVVRTAGRSSAPDDFLRSDLKSTLNALAAFFDGYRRTLTDVARLAQLDVVVSALAAIENAGFRVSPDTNGDPTLWCKACGRDSGSHYTICEKNRP